MKEIQLTQGQVALVDDEDYEYLSQWKWYYHQGYAMRNGKTSEGRKSVFLHRVIMNTPEGMETDHVNRNKLDDRKQNLRICTSAQNRANREKDRDATTIKYKGVSFHKRIKKWQAQISIDNHPISLGYFSDPVDAAHAYDRVAKDLRGDFAYLNFPGDVQ